jgi:hypothetical protein
MEGLTSLFLPSFLYIFLKFLIPDISKNPDFFFMTLSLSGLPSVFHAASHSGLDEPRGTRTVRKLPGVRDETI